MRIKCSKNILIHYTTDRPITPFVESLALQTKGVIGLEQNDVSKFEPRRSFSSFFLFYPGRMRLVFTWMLGRYVTSTV